jgi:hypothetical protein
MTRFLPRPRAIPPLLLALCAALSGCTGMLAQKNEAMQNTLATLPARCTLGDAAGKPGAWIAATQTVPAAGLASSWLYTFEAPVQADAFRVALNPNALRNLDRVQSRDAQGNWGTVWTGGQAGTPDGCGAVKMAQAFAGGRREITALRFVLRPILGMLTVGEVGVLKAG